MVAGKHSKKNSRRHRRGKKQSGGRSKSKSAFSRYLDNLVKSLDIKSGGAYSVDVDTMIAGLPAYKSYEDCSPPVVLNGKLVDKPCGTGCNLTGGKRKGSSKRSKKSKKLSKRNKKGKRKVGKSKRGGSLKKSKRKSVKSINKMRRKKKTQSAGGRLSPVDYPFQGEENVMTPDMNKRQFGCRQPKWDPKCV